MGCQGAQNIGGVIPKVLQKPCEPKKKKKDSQAYILALAAGEANQPNRNLFGRAPVMKTYKPASAIGKAKASQGRQTKLNFF